MTASAALRSPAPAVLAALGGGAAVAAGAGVAWLAVGRFGSDAPTVVVALAAAPVLAVAVVARPLLGPALVCAAFALGNQSPPGVPASLQAAEVVVVAVAGLVVLSRVAAGRLLPPWSPPLRWALALTVWVLLLVPFAVDTGLAAKQLASLVAGLLLVLVVLSAVESMRDVRAVLGVFAGAGAVLTALALASRPDLTIKLGGSIVEGRPTATFGEPNHFGAFAALAMPVALGLAFGARTRAGRVVAALATVLVAAGLFVSFSRGAWAAGAVAVALVVAVLPRARRLALVVGVPLVLAVSLATVLGAPPPGVDQATARVRSFTTLSPLDYRRPLQREAVRLIETRPLTGHGPGGFRPASAVRESSIRGRADHPYSLPLTWGAETGLVGLGLIAAFVAALAAGTWLALRTARARGDEGDRAVTIGVAAALLAVFVHGLFDYTLRNPVLWLAAWTLVGLLLACRREQLRRSAAE